jgi:hypothetical protein
MISQDPIAIVGATGWCRRIQTSPDDRFTSLDGESVELAERFFAVFDNRVRRASRYVQLSNLTTHDALQQLRPEWLRCSRLSLILGTSLGNLPDIIQFSREIVSYGDGPLSPGYFINAVGNAGLFYVARELGLECSSAVLSQESVSFEAALLAAAQQLRADDCDIAVVSGVDIVEAPAPMALRRFQAAGISAADLGEGGGALVLAKSPPVDVPILGWLDEVRLTFGGSLGELLESEGRSACNAWYFAAGMDQSQDELMGLAEGLSAIPYKIRAIAGDYPTVSAYVAAKFLMDDQIAPDSQLLHVNGGAQAARFKVRRAHR